MDGAISTSDNIDACRWIEDRGPSEERRAMTETVPTRVQLALNVDDVEEAVAFYSRLFGVGPAKRRPGYANFAVTTPPLKLVLLENPGQGGTLNHLGVEMGSIEVVDAEQSRLAAAGLTSVDERDSTCCYATQDKFWVEGAPDGERWEFYTVLADSPTFFGSASDGAPCCGGTTSDATSGSDIEQIQLTTAGSTGPGFATAPATPVPAATNCC
jgi:catechol 2,3-dioxygenase-like lactoylglutathione lyase family enzyme